MLAPRSRWIWALLAIGVSVVGLAGGYWASGSASPKAIVTDVPTALAEQDPAAVALRAVQEFGSPAMYDSTRRRDVLSQMADPPLADRLTSGLELAARGLGLDERGSSPDGALVARLIPVGHRVLYVSGDIAEISVWAVGLLGVAGPTSPHPVQASWSTEKLTLRHVAGRWLVTDLVHLDGPAPVGGGQVPAPPSELLQHIRGHESTP